MKCLLEVPLPPCQETLCTFCASIGAGVGTPIFPDTNKSDVSLEVKTTLLRWGPKSHRRWCQHFINAEPCNCGYADFYDLMERIGL